MFLDKLFVRIKGKLLSFKEDLSGEDLKEKAESLLERIDKRLNAQESAVEEPESRERAPGSEAPDNSELEGVKRQWEELKRLRGERSSEAPVEKPAKQNPRELG